MTKGRKRKPSYLKLLEDTARPDRANPTEPDASSRPMACPRWLPAGAKKQFKRIQNLMDEWGIDSAHYADAVTLLAFRLDEVESLTAALKKAGGVTYEVDTVAGGTMTRARPEVGMRNESLRHAQGLLAELGLSPTAKAKVIGGEKKKPNTFSED